MNETEKLLSLEPVIRNTARRICVSFPDMDEEEVVDEARLIAVSAIRDYCPGIGTLDGFVDRCIIYGIFERIKRSRPFRASLSKQAFVRLEHDPLWRSRFDFGRFMFDVSSDAGEVVRLAVQRGLKRTPLIQTLKKEFGWHADEIRKVFREIREAL